MMAMTKGRRIAGVQVHVDLIYQHWMPLLHALLQPQSDPGIFISCACVGSHIRLSVPCIVHVS